MASLQYDLVDLRLFINIAEEGYLTRGAERSGISLAAASLRIKNLEEALGAQLMTRGSQGIELTPAGRTMLAHALQVFQQLERLHGDLQVYSRGLKGKVRILANTTAMTEMLPAALGEYLASHPLVDIDLEERLSPDIARAVAEGLVDIGILAGSVQTEGLELVPYQRDRLVLAVPAHHPLSGRERVAFSEALGLNFVSLHKGSAIHGFMERIASEMRATLNIRIKVFGFETLCRMVEADVGVGVLPESAAKRLALSLGISIVGISDAWAERELKICLRKRHELPLFAQELVDFLVARSSIVARTGSG